MVSSLQRVTRASTASRIRVISCPSQAFDLFIDVLLQLMLTVSGKSTGRLCLFILENAMSTLRRRRRGQFRITIRLFVKPS